MEDFIKQLDEQVGRLCECDHILERKKRDYGCGFELTKREIHVLEAIANHPACNAGEVAEICGLLKGTFSKLTQHLTEVGLVKRRFVEGSNKEVSFVVTPLGWKAYEGHYRMHTETSEAVYRTFHHYTEQEREVILRFIGDYISYLEDYM